MAGSRADSRRLARRSWCSQDQPSSATRRLSDTRSSRNAGCCGVARTAEIERVRLQLRAAGTDPAVWPDGPVPSVAVTVTFELPALVGVPVISPLVGLIVRPAGRPVAGPAQARARRGRSRRAV